MNNLERWHLDVIYGESLDDDSWKNWNIGKSRWDYSSNFMIFPIFLWNLDEIWKKTPKKHRSSPKDQQNAGRKSMAWPGWPCRREAQYVGHFRLEIERMRDAHTPWGEPKLADGDFYHGWLVASITSQNIETFCSRRNLTALVVLKQSKINA